MALSQLYHLTANITSKRPAAGCWYETAALYAEEFLCLCQHVLQCQIPLLAQATQELRRSTRIRQPPNRLIEDPTWN